MWNFLSAQPSESNVANRAHIFLEFLIGFLINCVSNERKTGNVYNSFIWLSLNEDFSFQWN